MAERTLLARFSVICAKNDFSYISNTEEYCQEKINGNICYVFKQAGRELAFPDPPKLEHFKRGTQRKNKEEREKEN
uniref:Ground-like domain-containing protein n=1 Tax=Meloidogyne enterolobii TaxID=390850 RepID=A0A6V7UGX0_MELEN|nr:unnamed protein product [Meloidogyne enterolobii]